MSTVQIHVERYTQFWTLLSETQKPRPQREPSCEGPGEENRRGADEWSGEVHLR